MAAAAGLVVGRGRGRLVCLCTCWCLRKGNDSFESDSWRSYYLRVVGCGEQITKNTMKIAMVWVREQ